MKGSGYGIDTNSGWLKNRQLNRRNIVWGIYENETIRKK